VKGAALKITSLAVVLIALGLFNLDGWPIHIATNRVALGERIE